MLNDTDCSSWEKCNYGFCKVTYPTAFPIPTKSQFTYKPAYTYPDYDYCAWDSDCLHGSTCEDGHCVENDENYNGGAFSWSGSKVIGIIFFVVVATVISCLYHVCRRARKPPVLAPQIPPPTGVTSVREASTTSTTHHENTQPGSAVSNGATVIEMEEGNEDSHPLPAGAPPPYSSLEFERQSNENDEPELPPPSYDEAVKGSAMALV
ncbi:hypothetical protein OS493_021062 [Desmophyllum pertusum]|uniref:Uncharacterized protein n=1 Tax=Desmophyllum pertusum TaxID=174260 RepID=A0A9X0A055_9CNID|nr:hypothetical protein OS493_021062 [Desmophyllum pertusum]